MLVVFASHAGTAIAHARAYRDERRALRAGRLRPIFPDLRQAENPDDSHPVSGRTDVSVPRKPLCVVRAEGYRQASAACPAPPPQQFVARMAHGGQPNPSASFMRRRCMAA